jgi:hypothetical protein
MTGQADRWKTWNPQIIAALIGVAGGGAALTPQFVHCNGTLNRAPPATAALSSSFQEMERFEQEAASGPKSTKAGGLSAIRARNGPTPIRGQE